jgi:hypothetical protein
MFIKIARSIQVPALVAVCVNDDLYQITKGGDVTVYSTSNQNDRECDISTRYNTLEGVLSSSPSAISVYEGDEVTFKFG